MKSFYRIIDRVMNSRFIIIAGGLFSIAVIGSLLVFIFEPSNFKSPGDALWWAVVTITTVGYGDMVPHGPVTRIVASIVMLAGISFMSLFTATISSGFIARKIREGKGLEKINAKDHIVICGWNENIHSLLDSLSSLAEGTESHAVLVNNAHEEDIDNVIAKYPTLRVRYVKGDYTKIPILERANTQTAKAVIIIPNDSIEQSDPDEKTVLATLSVKSLNSETPVVAFIQHVENRSHLKRANADEIYVRDEFSGYILASHVLMPGISQAYYTLMSSKIHPSMSKQKVPSDFVGKRFAEYFLHVRTKQKALLLGFMQEIERTDLKDILSADSSHLDAFIEKKLRQAGRLGEKSRVDVNLNPDDDYIIKPNDIAIFII